MILPLLTTLVALAAENQDPRIVVPIQTNESGLTVSEQVPASTKLLRVTIQHDGEAAPQIQTYPVTDGEIKQNIYLHGGAGKYELKMWISNNSDAYQDLRGFHYIGDISATNTDTTRPGYALPSASIQSENPEIVALAQKITSGLATEGEKARAIHDWVTTNVDYDLSAYLSNAYLTKSYDALSVLHSGSDDSKRVSICFGYANLYAALARAAGLQAKTVTGSIIWRTLGETWNKIPEGHPHAWNEVLVDGKWLPLDAAWDAGFIVPAKTLRFISEPKSRYYNPTGDDFSDHKKISDDSGS